MPYKKKIVRKSKSVISENLRAYLLTGERAKGDAEVFRLAGSQDRLRAVWDAVKNKILPEFIKQNPCSRPFCWWRFDAPQEPVKCWINADMKEAQRKRLGGIGTPTFEVLGCGLGFSFGIPTSWVDQWQCDFYNGLAKDINGEPIGTEFKEGDFDGVAFDESDPPTFESQVAYLQRHGLLNEIEERYLRQHRELLKSEAIQFEHDVED